MPDTPDLVFPLPCTTDASLRDVLTAQLAGVDPHAEPPGHLGERGWLLHQGVADVLQPFVTALPRDDHDLVRYAGLTASAAGVLLETLTPQQLADRQNAAPTLATLLQAAVRHADDVELHGYVVGPARPDERLTAEGVDVYGLPFLDVLPDHGEGCECDRLWALVTERLELDPSVCGPHEITLRVNPWRPNEPCWRLWWD